MASTQLSNTFKIKKEDVGQFNPYYNDPDYIGIIVDGKSLIFIDIYYFCDCLSTFLEDEAMAVEAERQILSQFLNFLGNIAVLQWTNEITSQYCLQLWKQGLQVVLTALYKRFDIDRNIATRLFSEARLYLKDIAVNNITLIQYIQKMLRFARLIGILNVDNSNQQGVMIQVWNSMDLKIRQYLCPLAIASTLDQYIQHIEGSYTILLTIAYNYYLQSTSSSESGSSSEEDFRLRYRYCRRCYKDRFCHRCKDYDFKDRDYDNCRYGNDDSKLRDRGDRYKQCDSVDRAYQVDRCSANLAMDSSY